MKWLKRKKSEVNAPGTHGSSEVPLDLESLSFEDLDHMTNTVMWCRQNLEAMLDYIEFHRGDGHECPPFCFPVGITPYLEQLPKDHIILMLMVLMKDVQVTYEEPAA